MWTENYKSIMAIFFRAPTVLIVGWHPEYHFLL